MLRAALDGTPLTVPTGGIRRYVEELHGALRALYPEDEYFLVSDQLTQPRSAVDRRWWLWGLRRELIRRGASVFHGTDFSVPYLPPCPSVMTIHDLSPWRKDTRGPASARVRRRTPVLLGLGLATMVITPSNAVREEAIARFHLAPGRVTAVPLAAPARFRPVPEPAPTRGYFLFVGTIEARKNLAVAVNAWRELRKEADVDLVVAGRAREACDLDGARVLGEVRDEELPALYAGARAVVYPSLYEGFGLPVLEAMQCGAMVIASSDPAVAETAGDAAILAGAHDPKTWLEAMRLALRPEVRAGYRARSLKRAAEFSWERTARLTREVYVESLRRA